MTYIIAEIGLNHNGCVDTAIEMIGAAKDCGADCCKFQFFTEKEVLPVWGLVKDKIFGIGTLRLLREVCKVTGIDFLCSVFGIDSARHLAHYMPDLDSVKIPSGSLPNKELRDFCAERFKNVYVSTGMHNIDELLGYRMPVHWTVMHCVSAYPTDTLETNLASISFLKDFFPHVGFSDHSCSGEWKGNLAVAAGAEVIERHFNLYDNPCVDEHVSDTPIYFECMCGTIRETELIMGRRMKECMNSERVNLCRKSEVE